MRLLKANAVNFGSFKELDFNYTDLGLTLVYGATGSGKSTLQDVAPWILYGVTAKNGTVDEVRNWSAEGPTSGVLELEVGNAKIRVTRVRGTAHENDLYWEHLDDLGKKHRGKDLSDTQKLLNLFLNVDSDFYCTSAYFNEFSTTGLFFLAKAKEKRQLFEKLTPLDFPISLAEKIVTVKKDTKKAIDEANKEKARFSGKLEQLLENKVSLEKHLIAWDKSNAAQLEELALRAKSYAKEKASKLEALKTKVYRFESDKEKKLSDLIDKLDDLDQKILPYEELAIKIKEAREKLDASNSMCPTCLRPHTSTGYLDGLLERQARNDALKERFSDYSTKLLELQDHKNPYVEQLETEKTVDNPYDDQLKSRSKQKNPFAPQVSEILQSIEKTNNSFNSVSENLVTLEHKYNSLVQLYDLSFELRSTLLKNVVKKIQMNTNTYLEAYFDSEFKVSFDLSGSDSLDVGIQKNGYDCVYKQLSKGQRQLLKLCFSVAIMKAAANNIGQQFNVLCFDEALDGLDSDLKIKAFSLFSDLEKEHETILLIDHTPEFQNLFSNKFKVSLNGDESTVEHE